MHYSIREVPQQFDIQQGPRVKYRPTLYVQTGRRGNRSALHVDLMTLQELIPDWAEP